METRPEERTWKPTTAGILSIVAGAGGLIGGIIVVALGSILGGILGSVPEFLGGEEIDIALIIFGLFRAIGAPIIVLGIIAIVGGVFALRRRVWGLALAGAIFALLCEPILGILAIIFVVMGKREFA